MLKASTNILCYNIDTIFGCDIPAIIDFHDNCNYRQGCHFSMNLTILFLVHVGRKKCQIKQRWSSLMHC